ncbi:hypothetical protein IE53DRAFT_390579 [Violaceomyces palustris]|uniref:Uncharacterized protein n=1 Tax=Violaceomyces palustris TaxID=1673888 RepID=A0ACD0NN60_9BASI|nr:hypothetical protein IE53DRAFT_390579 [Violaceomyces palustris]
MTCQSGPTIEAEVSGNTDHQASRKAHATPEAGQFGQDHLEGGARAPSPGPSVASSSSLADADQIINPSTGPRDLDTKATILLSIQHVSSSWGYRSAEFAYPLFMVELFTGTLLPASIYGFVTTAAAILLSGSTGHLIDKYATTKLRTVRAFILAQKIFLSASYGLFLLLFLDQRLRENSRNGGRGPDPNGKLNLDSWGVFAAITFLGCGVILSNVGVSVGVERDWVTIIAKGSSARLTRLNAIMRRIDLLSNLLSPLFVSLLTTTTSNSVTVLILLGICALSTVFELLFIGIVYRRFSALAEEEARIRQRQEESEKENFRTRQQGNDGAGREGGGDSGNLAYPPRRIPKELKLIGRLPPIPSWPGLVGKGMKGWVLNEFHDWKTFSRLPIFLSSVCISLLYMSVLSFDSTFLAYLKSETRYSDAFIAGMRAACVVAGLMGTVVMPFLEKKIGLVRTGSYSLWMELLPLALAVAALFAGVPKSTSPNYRQRPEWNTGLLFTGLALSRIGLWSFDLAQLAQVQKALDEHPRKNSLMALQFSLQNLFDLGHYGLTLGWSSPGQFKYAAAVSYGAVGLATMIYIFGYARRMRGHVIHLDRLGLERLLGRKDQ